VDADVQTFQLPPQDVAACFRTCDETIAVRVGVDAVGSHAAGRPLFDDSAVLAAQNAMLLRCAPERWRVLLLLAAPVAFDPSTGVFRGRDADGAVRWRQQLANTVDDLAASAGAFYHPWALTQESVGAPIVEMPPTPLAAGIIARRDVALGPHVAPANERLVGVVGLSPPVDDAINAAIYETPLNINPLRAFAGLGIQLWGARTLSGDPWMRYLPVRRCLSAIERRAYAALRPLVFEPNTPTLWFLITQAILGILVPIFDGGALRGDTTGQAFYVRCDGSNNPPDTIASGQVLCEVGVAIAAPAEFIVFRVGRREGVVEVLE
jgi:phage tail sheath protein FI